MLNSIVKTTLAIPLMIIPLSNQTSLKTNPNKRSRIVKIDIEKIQFLPKSQKMTFFHKPIVLLYKHWNRAYILVH
jgi:hypothetical protein